MLSLCEEHLGRSPLRSAGPLGAFETLADLTVNPRRRRALHEQVQWLAELAGRTTEASHDRARIARRLMEVREALEAGLALSARDESAGEGKA